MPLFTVLWSAHPHHFFSYSSLAASQVVFLFCAIMKKRTNFSPLTIFNLCYSGEILSSVVFLLSFLLRRVALQQMLIFKGLTFMLTFSVSPYCCYDPFLCNRPMLCYQIIFNRSPNSYHASLLLHASISELESPDIAFYLLISSC